MIAKNGGLNLAAELESINNLVVNKEFSTKKGARQVKLVLQKEFDLRKRI